MLPEQIAASERIARLIAVAVEQSDIIDNLTELHPALRMSTDPVMGAVVTETPSLLLQADSHRIGAMIQSMHVDVAIAHADETPNFDGDYQIIHAGADIRSIPLGKSAIYAVARRPGGNGETEAGSAPNIYERIAVTVQRSAPLRSDASLKSVGPL